MRKGFLSIEWQDIEQHGLLIASVLAFTRYRHRFDPEWAPSRRVIAKEFKLGRVVAQDTVDKVCDILGIAHKRTTKKARTGTEPNHIVNTETHHIDERKRTTSGTKPHHIDDETEPPSIYNYSKTIIELSKEPINKGVRYPQWSSKFIMCSSLHKYLDNGEWFWMLTKKENEFFLWDYYNLPPTDTDHELRQVLKSECDYEFHHNMVDVIGDLTPQYFIDEVLSTRRPLEGRLVN